MSRLIRIDKHYLMPKRMGKKYNFNLVLEFPLIRGTIPHRIAEFERQNME